MKYKEKKTSKCTEVCHVLKIKKEQKTDITREVGLTELD